MSDLVTPVFSSWADGSTINGPTVPFGTPLTLTANTPVPIQIDYYQHLSSSGLILVFKGPSTVGAPGGFGFPSPTWLSPAYPTAAALPTGWSLSPDAGGGAVLRLGPLHRGRSHADRRLRVAPPLHGHRGGFTPPADEDGVLARDASGRLTLHAEDGLTYAFNTDGTLASATSAVDDRTPAAASYTWGLVPGAVGATPPMVSRLVAITDPVGARQITLRYAPDAACPTSPPTGLASARPGCCARSPTGRDLDQALVHPDRGQQSAAPGPHRGSLPGDVARVADSPPITDFAYDTTGRLVRLRSPFVADAVASGIISSADDNVGTDATMVTYDSASGKVLTVAAPTASPVAP